MKILFFLESLRSGGKERRAVELFYYIRKNTDINFQIVLTEKEVHYKYIFDLNIPIIVLERGFLKRDPFMFKKFFRIVKKFKPDIIHSWGAMTTMYAIPSAKILNIPLINGQIANTIIKKYRTNFLNVIWKINYSFSSIIISNSKAGLKAYNVNEQNGVVIHNGVRLDRFCDLEDINKIKEKFNIKTRYAVIMVASFNKYKNYELFFRVAEIIVKLRNDVTFIATGGGDTLMYYNKKISTEGIERVLFTGKISNVEELINAADIGVLFSNMLTGEGLSNTIIEYMALSKPVIATDVGGTRELVSDSISGFLINENIDLIIQKINLLLDNSFLRNQMGEKGRKIIVKDFSIDQMGKEFVKQYEKILSVVE